MPTCYLVLGTPRSGTSLVAGVLHHLGVRMGEYLGKDDDGVTDRWDWSEPNEWNPKGFFQDAAFVNFGHGLYGFPPSRPRRLIELERSQLAMLIGKRSGFGLDWGVKEPTIAFCLDDFVELCPDPVAVLLTRRDKTRCIRSWQDRSGHVRQQSEAVIETVDACLAGSALLAKLPSLVVDFDALIDQSAVGVRAIADFVGRKVTAPALALPDSSLRRY